MILKVKEPVAEEYGRIREDHLIFTYFHFAADETLTRTLIDTGAVAIAYETVQLPSGELPLLTPMSEIAGRMAVQAGAKYLERFHGGRGLLLGGVPGVPPADVAVDQGGCVETIRATTHADPIYEVEGVIHYGVANMPGGVPRTSTLALTNATFPYAARLARQGWREALRADPSLQHGLNIGAGKVVHPGVAEAFGLEHTPVDEVL